MKRGWQLFSARKERAPRPMQAAGSGNGPFEIDDPQVLCRPSVPLTVPLSLEVSAASDGIAVGKLGPVCIVLWRAAVTHPRFHEQRVGLLDVAEGSGGNAGFLCIIEPTADPPNAELRQASADLINGLDMKLKCVACVVEGRGIKAAIGRSVLTGMSMLSGRGKTPFEVMSDVDEAEDWMREHLSVPAGSVVRAAETLRHALDATEGSRSGSGVGRVDSWGLRLRRST